jgi:hypothetical protein
MTKAQRDKILSAITGSITAAGSGYTNTVNRYNLTGGSGTGAVADITVSGNVVTSVTIVEPGAGYVSTDVLSATITGGSGFTWTISAVTGAIAGSIIYQTDNTPGIRAFNGTNWMKYTETTD